MAGGIWPGGIWVSSRARTILTTMGRTAITPKRRCSILGLMAGERGFTLPEMTIVIVIMGIVLAISSASWFGAIESRRVDSATNQLVSDLRLAHGKATNRLTEHYVVYAPNNTVSCSGSAADYCLVKPDGAGGYEYTPRDLPDDTYISGTSLADDTVSGLGSLVGVTPKTLKFEPYGSAEPMGGLVSGVTAPSITVTGDGSPSHVIEVNTVTSRIKVD